MKPRLAPHEVMQAAERVTCEACRNFSWRTSTERLAETDVCSLVSIDMTGGPIVHGLGDGDKVQAWERGDDLWDTSNIL